MPLHRASAVDNGRRPTSNLVTSATLRTTGAGNQPICLNMSQSVRLPTFYGVHIVKCEMHVQILYRENHEYDYFNLVWAVTVSCCFIYLSLLLLGLDL